jgi:hypothetical protein
VSRALGLRTLVVVCVILLTCFLALSTVVQAEDRPAGSPKQVATSQGTFPLDDRGLPEKETISALFNEMDYQGAVQAYLWAMPQMAVDG